MTTSNHRPYTYPKGKVDIPSGTSRSGAVEYSDYALQQLMNMAKQQEWFKDTVFVIVADHCANSSGKVGLPVDKYHIPLFVYAPEYIEPGEVDKISSQIDIAPTLLSLLNFNYKSYFFGQDILSADFAERALIGNYQKLALYKNNKLVILSPQQKIGVMDDPNHSDGIVEEKTVLTDLDVEAMSYYQGSSYILKHHLNRRGES
jgi:phosphoglycerol transferase MdoB-like AlkP superfamily enzyme